MWNVFRIEKQNQKRSTNKKGFCFWHDGNSEDISSEFLWRTCTHTGAHGRGRRCRRWRRLARARTHPRTHTRMHMHTLYVTRARACERVRVRVRCRALIGARGRNLGFRVKGLAFHTHAVIAHEIRFFARALLWVCSFCWCMWNSHKNGAIWRKRHNTRYVPESHSIKTAKTRQFARSIPQNSNIQVQQLQKILTRFYPELLDFFWKGFPKLLDTRNLTN